MKSSVAFFLIGIMLSCQQPDLPQVPIDSEIDSKLIPAPVDQKNKSGKNELVSSDSIVEIKKRDNPEPKENSISKHNATGEVLSNEEEGNKNLKSKADTIYKYYQSKQVAIKFHPLIDGIKVIELFDLQGHLTYRFEEVHKSYSVLVSFKYYKNGAVKKAVVATNPGASLYHHKSTISFDNSNVPQWKKSEKIPSDINDLPENYYWNKRIKKWVKQETSKECAPVPIDS